jgi:hypothetical protein
MPNNNTIEAGSTGVFSPRIVDLKTGHVVQLNDPRLVNLKLTATCSDPDCKAVIANNAIVVSVPENAEAGEIVVGANVAGVQNFHVSPVTVKVVPVSSKAKAATAAAAAQPAPTDEFSTTLIQSE